MPRGIPHSVFLEWDPDDQDKALAWVRWNKRVCSCGVHPDEGSDFQPDHDICPNCENLERYGDYLTDGGKKRAPKGAKVYLLPNEVFQAREDERERQREERERRDAEWAAYEAEHGT